MRTDVDFADIEELRLLAHLYGDAEAEEIALAALSDPDDDDAWRRAVIRCINKGVWTSLPFKMDDGSWARSAIKPSCGGRYPRINWDIHRWLAATRRHLLLVTKRGDIALEQALKLAREGVEEVVSDVTITYHFKPGDRPAEAGWFWESAGTEGGGPAPTLFDAQQEAYEALLLGVPMKDPEGYSFHHSGCGLGHAGVTDSITCPNWRAGTFEITINGPEGSGSWLAVDEDRILVAPETFTPAAEVVL